MNIRLGRLFLLFLFVWSVAGERKYGRRAKTIKIGRVKRMPSNFATANYKSSENEAEKTFVYSVPGFEEDIILPFTRNDNLLPPGFRALYKCVIIKYIISTVN